MMKGEQKIEEIMQGGKAAAVAKSSPKGKSTREANLGDKVTETDLRPMGDFGNQQPCH